MTLSKRIGSPHPARVLPLLVLVGASFSSLGKAEGPAAPPATGPKGPKTELSRCAHVQGSVRAQGFGYTHIVTLHNGCDRPVACEVWTDVDPSPQYVLRAAAGQSDSIATRKGSPAREVRAESRCRFE